MKSDDPRQKPEAATGVALKNSTHSRRVTPSARRASRLALGKAARHGCDCAPDIVVLAHFGEQSWHLQTRHADGCSVLGEHVGWYALGGDAA